MRQHGTGLGSARAATTTRRAHGAVAAARTLRIATFVLALAAATTAAAQHHTTVDLLRPDWRERNAAAAALRDEDALTAKDLLDVLAADWDGGLVAGYGLGGGAGGRYRPDRLERRRMELKASLLDHPLPWTPLRPQLQREDLAIPRHPHELAAWLLVERGLTGPGDLARLAALLEGPEQVAITAAALLVRLGERAAAEVERAAAIPGRARAVVRATFAADSPAAKDRLARWLVDGPEPARREVLELGRHLVPLATARPDLLREAAALATAGDASRTAKLAGQLLVACGAAAVPPLQDALAADDPAPRRRAAGLLFLLGEHAAPAAPALCALLADADEDDEVRCRAAMALGAAALRDDVARDAAERLVAIAADDDADAILRLECTAALGGLGEAAGDAARAQLVELATGRLRFADARIAALQALVRLGDGARVPLDRLRYGNSRWFRESDLLDALAMHGAAAASSLEQLIAGEWVHAGAAERLATTAPDVLRTWLDSERLVLVRWAATGLAAAGANVSPERLRALLAHDDRIVRDAAIRWCCRLQDDALLMAAVDAIDPVDAAGKATVHASLLKHLVDRIQRSGFDEARRLGLLQRVFAASSSWWEVTLAEDDAMRSLCHRVLADRSAAPAGRTEAVERLCTLGLREEVEIAAAQDALRGESAWSVLDALAAGPTLPDALRPDVERLLDAAIARPDPARPDFAATAALDVLWAHRRAR